MKHHGFDKLLIAERFETRKLLAQGTDISTYEAFDFKLECVCILKILTLQKLRNWKRLELFQREARTLLNLEHPQIPGLLDYIEDRQKHSLSAFIAIEKMPGISLAQHVSEHYVLNESQAYAIACQLLKILTYLHSFNPPVIHRDLKPSNIILDHDERIALIDFGGVQETLGSGGSTLVGTYGYMAPEQFSGHALPQSDLYGLGTTLIYLLSGREPAQLPQLDMLYNFRPFLDCSERFASWIEQLILPAPEMRFKSAQEALEVLQDILPHHKTLRIPSQGLVHSHQPGKSERMIQALLKNPDEEPEYSELESKAHLEPGTVLQERYLIESCLGQSDIALTYAAQDLKSGQSIVLRELHFDRLRHWKSYELFERELKTLGRLQHRAIPRLLNHFEIRTADSHCMYLVSERVQGQTLLAKLQSGWRPDEDEVKTFALQLLEILDYLQTQDPPLIHRDIKPSNILVDANQQVYLIDFGAVQEFFRHQGGGGSTVIGTYGYMAPEQFIGKAQLASDLYGVGATLLHMLSGQSPAHLPQEELKIIFAPYIHCSRQLALWLEKMLAPKPEQRFESAWQASDVLQRLHEMPMSSPELLKLEASIVGKERDLIQISEDTDGLHLVLRPMFYDSQKLIPYVIMANIGLFTLFSVVPLLGGLLSSAAVLLSIIGIKYLQHEVQKYECLIDLNSERLYYRQLKKQASGTEVLEELIYPTRILGKVVLDHSDIKNRLAFRGALGVDKEAIFRSTNYPIAPHAHQAEYLMLRIQDALDYYHRQQMTERRAKED